VVVNKGQTDFANIDHEILSRATGKLAFDGDIASLSPETAERCRFWVSRYKEYRHLLVQDFRQLSPIPRNIDDWDVAAWSAYDQSEGVLAAYRFEGTPSSRWPILFADPEREYILTDLATGVTFRTDGATLRAGMEFKLPPLSACLFHFQRI
jgi:hypothetical protein